MAYRVVCGEGAGFHCGEAEESCWRFILVSAGEVLLFYFLIIYKEQQANILPS